MGITASQVRVKGGQTRERIKKSARELFSKHGVDKVTIRDIARNIGQNNGGSVNYHFGSKDKLIVEIVSDVGRAADRKRMAALDRLEASGRPITIRQIVEALLGLKFSRDVPMIRLYVMLELYRPDLIIEILDKYNRSGVKRCMDHLSKLLPDIPRETLNQRASMILGCAWLFIVTRDDKSAVPTISNTPSGFENLLDSAVGMLIQPPSKETLAALRTEKRRRPESAKNAA